MSPQDWLIITAAALDVIFLIVMGVVALRFKALAGEAAAAARPLVERGRRIAGTGRRLSGTLQARGEAMLRILRALGRDVSARVETTRRIAQEVVHPEPTALDTFARQAETTREWTARLGRLGAAARRAAGANGHNRRRV